MRNIMVTAAVAFTICGIGLPARAEATPPVMKALDECMLRSEHAVRMELGKFDLWAYVRHAELNCSIEAAEFDSMYGTDASKKYEMSFGKIIVADES